MSEPMRQHIDEDTEKNLEISFILDQLAEQAYSPYGAKRLKHPDFITDERELEKARDITAEIYSLFDLGAYPKLQRLEDITDILKSLRIPGARSSGEDLWNIKMYADTRELVSEFLQHAEKPIPLIEEIFEELPDLSDLSRQIGSYLVYPGTVREDHPRIRRMIEAIQRSKQQRSQAASAYFREDPDSFQAQKPVFRDNRMVLPVKSREKSRYPGMFHAASQTGSTVFLEPTDLVDKNNSVAAAEQRLLIEIEKIHSELTAAAALVVEDLQELLRAFAEFDLVYTRAYYCYREHFVRPVTSENGMILRGIRHPMLREKAIPLDVKIADTTKAMIMSGPNAGGKTVTLKTIGLAAVLNQFGMYLPLSDGSSLPIFSAVYTDIGDEQSIERELSTFSGHMKRIGSILDQADSRSLVIFDELGSGTDPVEGAALAQSILEHGIASCGLILITSHHTSLKQFGYTREDVINASMEFDPSRKEPTYHVIIGEPGDSYALETAVRMQLPGHIITRAKNILGEEYLHAAEVMKSLKKREQELEREQKEIVQREQRLREQIRENDLFKLRIRQQEQILKKEDATELRKYVRSSRKVIENLIRELRENELTKDRIKQTHTMLESLEETADTALQEVQESQKKIVTKNSEKDPGLKTGDRVMILSSRREGTIAKKERKETYLVALDNGMRMSFSRDALKLLGKEDRKEEENRSWNSKVHVYMEQVETLSSMTIDVRGCTLSEAMGKITQHIDKALMTNMHEIAIIHGKGSGVLQQGIHDALSHMQMVKDHRFARPEDGGYGKTYVTLV